ncbi:MAG TPA: SCP2 sterol-binding domain-containing protein [Acidimicrobiales bacterium]
MPTPTDQFFEQLGRRRNDPLLRACIGSMRFDLQRGNRHEHWRLDLRKGDATAERCAPDSDAACVVRGDGELFDDIVTGRANAMAALLRGAYSVEGDVGLLMAFQRLLPGPPNQRGLQRSGEPR